MERETKYIKSQHMQKDIACGFNYLDKILAIPIEIHWENVQCSDWITLICDKSFGWSWVVNMSYSDLNRGTGKNCSVLKLARKICWTVVPNDEPVFFLKKLRMTKKKLDWCSPQVQKQREDRDSHFSACLDENIWVAICLFFFSIQFHPNMILDDNIMVCSFFFF